MVGYVAAALLLRRKGRIAFRWWVLPVFIASVLLSLPFLISFVVPYVVGLFTGGQTVAIWIKDAWKAHGWLTAFCWVPVLVLFIVFKKLTFASRRMALQVMAVVVLLTLPLTGADGLVTKMFVDLPGTHVADGISPDAQIRFRATSYGWWDSAWYTLESEENRPYPWLSWRLGDAYVDPKILHEKGAAYHLVWSRDSAIAALYLSERPLAAYDFSHMAMVPNYFGDLHMQDARKSLAKDLDVLMSAHGGPVAP